ncbi:hypothetical protein K4K49_011029 [Colletotrichum sp. SAR 10_70]|nr:hypothetical protein K4K49_011029 [Colletotrichum sp. SAR 10_70]KAI8155421.1 hypothetical protein K4K50_006588 [Colletotrichum sp. SAR 10_71]
MPTAPPYLHSYPAEKRREVWLQWAVYNISPVFGRFPGERAYVVFQLENLEWTKGTHLPPANSDSDAWCRLKQTWGPSEPPPKGTIPSVADCEVVRLLNKGYIHEYIELNLRKHGWDPYKCCDPSLKVEQKRLNAPSPAKPSSSAAATPASTGVLDPSNAVQDPAKSCDELEEESFGRHPRSVPLANDSTPQNVKRNLQSHDSQSRPAAEKDSKTQSPASENLQTTVTPKEEYLRVNDDPHKNNIERMSAKLFKSSRPILHAYLRDEIEAMSKTVMGNMRKRTVEVLGRQSNSHLGFAILRDVEDLTLAMMEAEINSVRKATLEQIDKLDKQGSDVPIKREASEFEEGGVAEHAREAKRQRTSNSANSQECVQS